MIASADFQGLSIILLMASKTGESYMVLLVCVVPAADSGSGLSM